MENLAGLLLYHYESICLPQNKLTHNTETVNGFYGRE